MLEDSTRFYRLLATLCRRCQTGLPVGIHPGYASEQALGELTHKRALLTWGTCDVDCCSLAPQSCSRHLRGVWKSFLPFVEKVTWCLNDQTPKTQYGVLATQIANISLG